MLYEAQNAAVVPPEFYFPLLPSGLTPRFPGIFGFHPAIFPCATPSGVPSLGFTKGFLRPGNSCMKAKNKLIAFLHLIHQNRFLLFKYDSNDLVSKGFNIYPPV